MKMEEQKSICLSGRPMDFLLSSVPGKNGYPAFPRISLYRSEISLPAGKDRAFSRGK